METDKGSKAVDEHKTDSAGTSKTSGLDGNKIDEDLVKEDESFMQKVKNFLHITGKKESDEASSVTSLDDLVESIQNGSCHKVIVLAGAGISTSAGIPDFRSAGTGLYSNLRQYNLPYPEAIFQIDFFKKNPKPFFVLCKELWPQHIQPTLAHFFVRLLHEKGMLLRHYTQNVDTLEHHAGIPEAKIVEAHGTFRTAHCIKCRHGYPQDWIKEKIFTDQIPLCTSCNSVVKPDVILFGESMPSKFFSNLNSDFGDCDLLVVMGTSLQVQPFASLVSKVPSSCPRLLINREKPTKNVMSSFLSLFGGGMGKHVAMIGDCDEQCLRLAEKLGWKDELLQLQSATLVIENKM